MLSDKRIGFIGGGAMAEAIARGIIEANLVSPDSILVSEINQERANYLSQKYSVRILNSQEVADEADILFLTVKPQVIYEVVDDIASYVSKETVVISVAAGIRIGSLQAKMPEVPIVRVMPNTPVSVGAGMCAISLGKYCNKDAQGIAVAVFSAVGRTVVIDEDMMDGVTGLSGSGPAYAFLLIEALADAGVLVGFSRQTALLLSAQTLLGAAKMVLEMGEHPAKLRDMVTSPGGTAIRGIHVLEQNGVRAALIDAVVASANRSYEMGRKDK